MKEMKDTLVIYYSFSGNSKRVAEHVKNTVGSRKISIFNVTNFKY